jgi:hypothetical protein
MCGTELDYHNQFYSIVIFRRTSFNCRECRKKHWIANIAISYELKLAKTISQNNNGGFRQIRREDVMLCSVVGGWTGRVSREVGRVCKVEYVCVCVFICKWNEVKCRGMGRTAQNQQCQLGQVWNEDGWRIAVFLVGAGGIVKGQEDDGRVVVEEEVVGKWKGDTRDRQRHGKEGRTKVQAGRNLSRETSSYVQFVSDLSPAFPEKLFSQTL